MRALLLLFFPLLLAAASASGAEVRVFAAASLTDAMDALTSAYAETHPEVDFVRHYAASGTLARQILAGAPTDLYASANPQWMDHLVAEGRVSGEAVRILARNALVFIGRQGAADRMEDLPGLERIALGSPQSVPAGQYARQALTGAGLYASLRREGRLVFARDVRQALIYADRGEVDGAFVYRTDARLARQATVLFTVPRKLYPPVTCPLALTPAGAQNAAARGFFEFLRQAPAKRILKRFGFGVPAGP